MYWFINYAAEKNPDVPELVRGKTGRINGHLIALLTLMKSQPLAYNKDNQEDKEPLFDTVETIKNCLKAFTGMVPEIRPNKKNMAEAARKGFSTATDLADYLVRKKFPSGILMKSLGRQSHSALQTIKIFQKCRWKNLKNSLI